MNTKPPSLRRPHNYLCSTSCFSLCGHSLLTNNRHLLTGTLALAHLNTASYFQNFLRRFPAASPTEERLFCRRLMKADWVKRAEWLRGAGLAPRTSRDSQRPARGGDHGPANPPNLFEKDTHCLAFAPLPGNKPSCGLFK